MTTVIFIRHCEATGQAPEAPLTIKGLADAQTLVERLASFRFDALYSSPFRRAVQTVEPLAAALGLPILMESRLQERRLSGEPLTDWLDHVRRSFDDFDYRAPGGESLADAQRRGLEALQRIHNDNSTCSALVSHGNLLASLLRYVDAKFTFAAWQGMPNPALYRVQLTEGMPVHYEPIT